MWGFNGDAVSEVSIIQNLLVPFRPMEADDVFGITFIDPFSLSSFLFPPLLNSSLYPLFESRSHAMHAATFSNPLNPYSTILPHTYCPHIHHVTSIHYTHLLQPIPHMRLQPPLPPHPILPSMPAFQHLYLHKCINYTRHLCSKRLSSPIPPSLHGHTWPHKHPLYIPLTYHPHPPMSFTPPSYTHYTCAFPFFISPFLFFLPILIPILTTYMHFHSSFHLLSPFKPTFHQNERTLQVEAHAIIANDGIMAPVGLNMVTLAVQRLVIPQNP